MQNPILKKSVIYKETDSGTDIQVGINSDKHLIKILSVLALMNYWIESMQCNQPAITWVVKLHVILS